MANEVIIKKSNVLSVESSNIQLPDFKQIDLGDEPRKLKIKVTNGKKDDGSTFKKVTGYVVLDIYEGIEDEAKFVRRGIKRISVHFKKVAFKEEAGENLNVHDIEDLQSGHLFVKAKGLRIPSIYKLRYEHDKDGNIMYDNNGEAIIKYPEIWVERGMLGFIPFVTAQDSLNVENYKDDSIDAEASDVKVDEETGEVMDEDISEAISEEPEDEEETNF